MLTMNVTMKNGALIENCAEYVTKYRFIVARYGGGSWWFWGAWNDESEAEKAATAIGGRVFRRA